MGFFGFIILLVIAAGIWQWIKEQSHGRRNVYSSNRIAVNCPYCHERLEIEEPGNWNCAYCHKNFIYDNNGRTYRLEDYLSPAIEALVVLFAKTSKADGVVTENEINLVDRIIKEEFSPSESLLAEIRHVFNTAKSSSEGYQQAVHELYNFFSGEPEVLYGISGYLREIAMLDHGIHPGQEAILRYSSEVFRLNQSQQGAGSSHSSGSAQSNASQGLDQYYAVLECQPTDSIETIKSNYRRLIKEYHPDKYINQNLPKDFIELANKKVKDIKEAYDIIMKQKTSP
ncbi:MAG: TerB family tellurite resistance protein [Tuberibacillus sp.]